MNTSSRTPSCCRTTSNIVVQSSFSLSAVGRRYASRWEELRANRAPPAAAKAKAAKAAAKTKAAKAVAKTKAAKAATPAKPAPAAKQASKAAMGRQAQGGTSMPEVVTNRLFEIERMTGGARKVGPLNPKP